MQPQNIDKYAQYEVLMHQLEPSRMAIGASGSSVTYLQCLLRLLTYYNAPADGRFGPKTAEAIAQIQRYFGFQETGEFDFEVWYALSFWVPDEMGWRSQSVESSSYSFGHLDNWLQACFQNKTAFCRWIRQPWPPHLKF